MPKLYGWVREVVPGSAADLAGIQPGDLLKTINGNPVRDFVDYQFYASDGRAHPRHRPQRARP